MKRNINEQELKQMIRHTVLESPGDDFTSRVMVAIASKASASASKRDPLLGKSFWIFVALFAVLGLVLSVIQGINPIPDSGIGANLGFDWSPQLPQMMRSTFAQIGRQLSSLPAGLAYIMLTSTALLIADKFWSLSGLTGSRQRNLVS